MNIRPIAAIISLTLLTLLLLTLLGNVKAQVYNPSYGTPQNANILIEPTVERVTATYTGRIGERPFKIVFNESTVDVMFKRIYQNIQFEYDSMNGGYFFPLVHGDRLQSVMKIYFYDNGQVTGWFLDGFGLDTEFYSQIINAQKDELK